MTSTDSTTLTISRTDLLHVIDSLAGARRLMRALDLGASALAAKEDADAMMELAMAISERLDTIKARLEGLARQEDTRSA